MRCNVTGSNHESNHKTIGVAKETRDIYEGLTSDPKDISAWPKYLYDAKGSSLFEEITRQPEYYQTSTELSILGGYSGSIVSQTGSGGFGELVEIGSGSSTKTKKLLEEMVRSKGESEVRYVALDISKSAVDDGLKSVSDEYPGMEVSGHIGDFNRDIGSFLSSLERGYGSRLVIFLGGTLGNFTGEDRTTFLEGVASGLGQGDRFLVGVDLIKNVEILKAAYDDEKGITAAFNRNMLSVINDSLGADFEPELFDHEAVYNDCESRVEMWLVSRQEQEVTLGDPGLSVNFETGEGVRTEISTKFSRDSAASMFEGSGLRLSELYTDREELFGLAIGEPE